MVANEMAENTESTLEGNKNTLTKKNEMKYRSMYVR
jgi:hypothetical protein